ncbi:MAG: hypothetical protein AB8H86_28545 [Polyangiales bacterium]
MRRCSFCSLILAGLAMVGCGGPSGAVGDTTESLEGSRGDETVREQCDVAGAQITTSDVNGDGTPDVRHVSVDGRRRCSEYDFDFRSPPDLTRFYAEDGTTVIREEHDLDFDQRLDQILYFENGQLARKELDTNFNNRIDTWMWCEGGTASRSERDRLNDGDVDTWETYENGLLTEASYDDDGDGLPEKWEIFSEGRLTEIRHDTDRDGEPDRAEEIPADSAGLPEERIACSLIERSDEEEEPAAPENGTVPDAEGEGESEGETSGGETPAPTGDPITDGLNAEQDQ